MAEGDIPAWVHKRNWKVSRHHRAGNTHFLSQRPAAFAS